MPKSKSRGKQRPRRASDRYRLDPDRKQRHKASPRWYGPLILTIMGIGVVMIVANYMGILPGTSASPRNAYLFGGLALIALGFLGTTRWR
jgi:cell division protein CrgA